MAELKDSGARRDFGTGAVRDIAEGKGRCDLLPMDQIAGLLDDYMFKNFEMFRHTGRTLYLTDILENFMGEYYKDVYTAILELAKHYEDGARKYSDRNWENGIPLHCFIDSAVRHYLKFRRGDKDEPHDRAFMWNVIGAVWTYVNHPELDDYTDKNEEVKVEKRKPKKDSNKNSYIYVTNNSNGSNNGNCSKGRRA